MTKNKGFALVRIPEKIRYSNKRKTKKKRGENMFKKKSKISRKIANPVLVKRNGNMYLKDIESGYMLKYDLFVKVTVTNK